MTKGEQNVENWLICHTESGTRHFLALSTCEHLDPPPLSLSLLNHLFKLNNNFFQNTGVGQNIEKYDTYAYDANEKDSIM